MYRAATNRAPSPTEQASGEIALTRHSRSAFVRSVLQSPARLTSRVRLTYDRTLDRAPDPGGLSYWKAYSGDTGRLSRMLAVQMASAEAWNVAQRDGVAAGRGSRLFP